jgi:hypothetical protein
MASVIEQVVEKSSSIEFFWKYFRRVISDCLSVVFKTNCSLAIIALAHKIIVYEKYCFIRRSAKNNHHCCPYRFYTICKCAKPSWESIIKTFNH